MKLIFLLDQHLASLIKLRGCVCKFARVLYDRKATGTKYKQIRITKTRKMDFFLNASDHYHVR